MIVYVGLGSNLGDRGAQIRAALDQLGALPGTIVAAVSSVYETAPIGAVEQPWFLNAVARLETELEPRQLLWNLLRIEHALGRERRQLRGPRVIDLDLLLADDLVLDEPGLRLPHPELVNRAFVLVPLTELDPMLVHPETGETMLRHLSRLGSSQVVRPALGQSG